MQTRWFIAHYFRLPEQLWIDLSSAFNQSDPKTASVPVDVEFATEDKSKSFKSSSRTTESDTKCLNKIP